MSNPNTSKLQSGLATYRALQQVCKNLGLSTKGNTEALMSRLKAHQAKLSLEAEKDVAPPAEPVNPSKPTVEEQQARIEREMPKEEETDRCAKCKQEFNVDDLCEDLCEGCLEQATKPQSSTPVSNVIRTPIAGEPGKVVVSEVIRPKESNMRIVDLSGKWERVNGCWQMLAIPVAVPKADKPVVQPVAVPVAQPVVQAVPSAPRAPRAPSAGRQQVLGYSVSTLCQWMGWKGWAYADAVRALQTLGVDLSTVKESTIKTGLTDGKNPKYSQWIKGTAQPMPAACEVRLNAAREGRIAS
jgi:hypothetical protein